MKVAFIDRDGTLIVGPRLLQEDPPLYDEILCIDQLQILPGVEEGLRALMNAGYLLVMVTNQEGLGSDTFPCEAFEMVQEELQNRLKVKGIAFAEVFLCPHLPEENCICRKPLTGLVDDYLQANDVDRTTSLVIGDRISDEEFACNIGCAFIRAVADKQFPLKEIQLFLSACSS